MGELCFVNLFIPAETSDRNYFAMLPIYGAGSYQGVISAIADEHFLRF